MSYFPFTISAGQSVVDSALGFLARTVLVDNPSGQWYFIPSENRYVPPYTTGVVVPLSAGTQKASLIAQTPSGSQSNPQAGQQVHLNYTDDNTLPSNAGVSTNSSAQFQSQELPTFTVINQANGNLGDGLLVLYNPTTSKKIIKLRKYINFTSTVNPNIILGGIPSILLRINGNPTGGVTLPPYAHDSVDDNTSIAIVKTQVLSANLLPVSVVSFGGQPSEIYSQPNSLGVFWNREIQGEIYNHLPGQYSKPLTFRPGEGMAQEQLTGSASGLGFTSVIVWTEEPLPA